MLSYRHEYHAGNHADVVKHAVLALLIDALQRKPTPIRVIDSHAGTGVYDLTSREAQQHREFAQGIARIVDARPVPPELSRYVAAIEALNDGDVLLKYPGSPQLARMLLRDGDHLELFELHPQACASLEAAFGRDRRVHIHRRDAFEGVPAVVPPPERRGLVLIDPAYERREEFDRVLAMLPALLERWPNGVYAVWYPLLRKPEARAFVRQLRALEMPRPFQVELQVAPAGSFGLLGSGLVIANLPYGLDAQLKTVMPWLHRRLAPEGAGSWQARPLAP
ncbi:MAG TPA: 23S rRNA (adenine(2030)-N(6))-methyltransferase RlmJ [Gammaproteobacteria bacterium]